LDSGAFAVALASKPDQVAQVFAALGRPSHADVVYLSSTVDTQPSGAAGWEVQITQAAAQARLTGGVAQTSPLAADETLTIRGIPISLTASMTQEEVVSAINAQSAQTGVLASATGAGGTGVGTYLTLTRVAYGSAHHVDAVSTASNQGGEDTSGMGAVAVSDESPAGEGGLGAGAVGTDVQGTIGGEAATGSGQILTGAAGSPKGLALLVKATAPGSYGSVVFTVGAAEAAFRVALSATDATSIADLIANMDEQIGRLQASADREIQRMRTAFARMETALGRFQAQNQYLAGQISQMQLNAAAASRQ
jgi:flagellar hook-associated protein 2